MKDDDKDIKKIYDDLMGEIKNNKKNKLEILNLSLEGIKNDKTFKEMKKSLLKIRILLILEEEGLNKKRKPRKNVTKYFNSILNLEDLIIVESDINLFYSSGTRSTNDGINKKREKIICDLWNKKISNDWTENNSKWGDLYEEIKEYLNSLVEDYNHCVLNLKGGRGKHHDIDAIFTMKDG